MLKQLTKIQARPDLVDQVYQSLLDAISDGSLPPGTRITQEEIAEQMDVSRSPVLQALRLLKKDGLVQDAPGRGVLVAELDPEWIGNLYQVAAPSTPWRRAWPPSARRRSTRPSSARAAPPRAART
jgi:DNA-binding GntR family transcriptional regulator